MKLSSGLLALILAAPLWAALPDGAMRPAPPMLPRSAPALRAPRKPGALDQERVALKAAWSGTVLKRARTRAAAAVAGKTAADARAALRELSDELRRDEAFLRDDRSGAAAALARSAPGSPERVALREAVEVDTILLDDYPAAYAAIARSLAGPR